jgi:hypothetical protein
MAHVNKKKTERTQCDNRILIVVNQHVFAWVLLHKRLDHLLRETALDLVHMGTDIDDVVHDSVKDLYA